MFQINRQLYQEPQKISQAKLAIEKQAQHISELQAVLQVSQRELADSLSLPRRRCSPPREGPVGPTCGSHDSARPRLLCIGAHPQAARSRRSGRANGRGDRSSATFLGHRRISGS
eukprot:5058328-Pyramimonas_sp.AAC.1